MMLSELFILIFLVRRFFSINFIALSHTLKSSGAVVLLLFTLPLSLLRFGQTHLFQLNSSRWGRDLWKTSGAPVPEDRVWTSILSFQVHKTVAEVKPEGSQKKII